MNNAWEVFKRGHIPVIGVNAALAIIEVAGAEHFDEIMMPVPRALAERCDAVLRIGGRSEGADEEVDIFKMKGLTVFNSLEEIPESGGATIYSFPRYRYPLMPSAILKRL